MTISRYTFILDSNGRYYLYNSLSNALVETDHETYSFLKEHETGGTPVDESALDESLRRMLLTWFGGEPLMAQPLISRFYRKLRSSFTGDIQSDIITTGYHIDGDTVDLFRETGISSVQITLDGGRESHNRVKFTDGCNDVFSRTIENVRLLAEELPDMNIVFRVNVTKKNAASIRLS